MKPIRPSRQALQTLARLCHNIETPIPTTATRRALYAGGQTQAQVRSCRPHSRQNRTSNPTSSTRTFTTTHRAKVQPNTSSDADPQNQAAPLTLPDITNYYTLFPATIPQGPPSPAPPTQSPTPPDPSSSSTTTSSSSSPSFTIHLPTLRQEFLRLQSTHHPDKFPTGSTAHQKALALSSLINTAYKTLSDPLLRAQYLLQIQYDIDVTTEDNAAHPTDQETLMEVMEAQERVEGAKGQEEVDALKGENAERMIVTERVLGEAFEQGDVGRAKDEAVRLKYWRSLQDALNDWEEGKEVRLIH